MMINEFVRLTGGFEPTEAEYREIEKQYMESDESKQDFCKRFVREGGINRLVAERAKEILALKNQISERDSLISDLQKSLDKELEWKDCDCGTSVPETYYQRLADSLPDVLSISEAKSLLHKEFGFDPECVTILSEVKTYEINKYHHIREKNIYKRQPLYASSDWNYIRFNCAGWQWELVNGQLLPYNI